MSPARPVPDRLRVVSGLDERAKNLSVGIGTPRPPRHLPPAARKEWRRVVKACAPHGIWLQHTDLRILEAWCVWSSVWDDAVLALATDGILIAGRSSADKARGAQVKHPAVAVLRAATTELRALSQRLGFDPDSRTKIGIGPADDDGKSADDPFDW